MTLRDEEEEWIVASLGVLVGKSASTSSVGHEMHGMGVIDLEVETVFCQRVIAGITEAALKSVCAAWGLQMNGDAVPMQVVGVASRLPML